MKIQEYPKALYKDGDQTAEPVIVADAKEEAVKRKTGFKMLGEPESEEKPKAKTGKQADAADKTADDTAPATQDDKAAE